MVLNGRSNNMLPYLDSSEQSRTDSILSDSVPLPKQNFIWSTFQTPATVARFITASLGYAAEFIKSTWISKVLSEIGSMAYKTARSTVVFAAWSK